MAKLKRINARIESDLERLVQELAQVQGLSMSEIVVKALKEFCASQYKNSSASAFEAFSKAGLIGCFKGGKDLSQNYKQELDKALQDKWPGN